MFPLFALQILTLFTLIICGTKLLSIAVKFIKPFNEKWNFFEIIIAGCISLTIYAQMLSLFLPCNLIFLLPFIALCLLKNNLIVHVFINTKKYLVNNYKISLFWIIVFFTTLCFFYFNYYPTQNPDSMGYHAQMVDIFANFKIIPGIANLHSRAGFNNNNF